jgi:hypothetical protein
VPGIAPAAHGAAGLWLLTRRPAGRLSLARGAWTGTPGAWCAYRAQLLPGLCCLDLVPVAAERCLVAVAGGCLVAQLLPGPRAWDLVAVFVFVFQVGPCLYVRAQDHKH